jgi:hypothetical protein
MISTTEKINFLPITPDMRETYEGYLFSETERGCEFSFSNLYLWGRQKAAFLNGTVFIFSQFDRRTVYPYPLGGEDKKAAIDAIIADAESRGIPCRITGIGESARGVLEELYPGRFQFHTDEGSYDYVYDINDLADLEGKKYHPKRNHLNRFEESCPDYSVVPFTEENIAEAQAFCESWYERRIAENPDADYHMERAAINKAFRDYFSLGLCGIMLTCGEEVLAITMASKLSHDTLDVHFEKARSDVQGAYAAINRSLACYVREKYPEIKYLNREEDMGLEGLRRAKKSYHPHHRVKKYWAHLLEDGYDY